MRVIRTILGMLMLTVGLPALLVGAGFWAVMQHRDAGGAFSGTLQPLTTPGYAVVVGDLDALLRDDASFVRVSGTRLRLTATAPDGPAFIGIAPAAQAARYLSDVPHTTVRSVNIATGTLPLVTRRVGGARTPTTMPGAETFWTRAGAGHLEWTPADLRGDAYSLVIMSRSARPGLRLEATAEVRPGWLNSSTWALLMLGSLSAISGLILLGWPGRRREIVYVVEPSQVPELMKTIGSPLALGRAGGGRHAANRPRTLADAQPKGGLPARPQLSWPPAEPAPASAVAEQPVAAVASPVQDAGSAGAGPVGAPIGSDSTTVPGEPLSPIGGPGPAVSSTLAAAAPEMRFGRAPAERVGRRRAGAAPSGDTPIFEASAVGAWVAETAAARARETAARAAAARAAALGEPTDKRAGGPADGSTDGLADVQAAGLADVQAAGLADVQAAGLGDVQAAELADVQADGSVDGLIDRQADGLADGKEPAPTEPVLPASAGSPGSVSGAAVVRPGAPRFTLGTGPKVTDWTAVGMPRSGSPRRGPASPGPSVSRPVTDQPAHVGVTDGPLTPADEARPARVPSPQRAAAATTPEGSKLKHAADRLAEMEGSTTDKTGSGGAPAEGAVADSAGSGAPLPVPSTVVASSDDPDAKLAGPVPAARADIAYRRARPTAKPAPGGKSKAQVRKSGDAPSTAAAARAEATKADGSAADAAKADGSAADAAKADGTVVGAAKADGTVVGAAKADGTVVGAAKADGSAAGAAKAVQAGGKAATAARSTGGQAAAPKPAAVKTARPASTRRAASGGQPAPNTPAPRSDKAADADKPTDKPTAGEQATPADTDHLVPSARHPGYQLEAAELLAGAAARRKQPATSAAGLPAPDPAPEESPIRLTRPPRPGSTKPQAED